MDIVQKCADVSAERSAVRVALMDLSSCLLYSTDVMKSHLKVIAFLGESMKQQHSMSF